jgi:hypothetical protein
MDELLNVSFREWIESFLQVNNFSLDQAFEVENTETKEVFWLPIPHLIDLLVLAEPMHEQIKDALIKSRHRLEESLSLLAKILVAAYEGGAFK